MTILIVATADTGENTVIGHTEWRVDLTACVVGEIASFARAPNALTFSPITILITQTLNTGRTISCTQLVCPAPVVGIGVANLTHVSDTNGGSRATITICTTTDARQHTVSILAEWCLTTATSMVRWIAKSTGRIDTLSGVRFTTIIIIAAIYTEVTIGISLTIWRVPSAALVGNGIALSTLPCRTER